MNDLYTFGSFLNVFIALCTVGVGILAVKSAKRNQLMKLQEDSMTASEQTISALKDRLDLIEKRQAELEKENASLRQIIETIKSALLKRGIHVTIDGEMVVIEETGRTSVVRPSRARTKDNGGN